MVLPGWCCCDAWQHWQYWGPEQYVVAGDSLRDQLMRMRIHPSAIAFWYSSDQLPPPDVEQVCLIGCVWLVGWLGVFGCVCVCVCVCVFRVRARSTGEVG